MMIDIRPGILNNNVYYSLAVVKQFTLTAYVVKIGSWRVDENDYCGAQGIYFETSCRWVAVHMCKP